MFVCFVCFLEPSWAVGALCVVSLCIVLSCVVCIWKKRLTKKDKDKEKDKKKENEKSKGGFDTEMDGGHDEVSYRTHKHTHFPTADALSLRCSTVLACGSPRTTKTVRAC